MMKKIVVFAISLFVIVNNLQAQDLIVTNNGDSINCKIAKIAGGYVHFIFKYKAEIRNTLLPIDQIAAQQKDYFSVSEVPENYTYKDIFPHFRVAVDAGGQYRTAKLASGMDTEWQKHYKKMKSGFHYDIQAAYFFLENQGIELMLSKQLFEHGLGEGYMSDAEGNIIGSGDFNEKIAFDYLGANYLFRLFDSKKKNCWLLSVGLGYMGYTDRSLFDNIEKGKMTAATFGSILAIGYDIGLSKDFGIGFKLSYMDGYFKNYKKTINGITTNETMADKTSEGLGTLRLSVGLRFNK